MHEGSRTRRQRPALPSLDALVGGYGLKVVLVCVNDDFNCFTFSGINRPGASSIPPQHLHFIHLPSIDTYFTPSSLFKMYSILATMALAASALALPTQQLAKRYVHNRFRPPLSAHVYIASDALAATVLSKCSTPVVHI